MFKASQQALYQETNQQIIGIRQSEVQYYTNVNITLGTQAALIGGFTYGVFTMSVPNPDNAYSDICQTAYYIAAAITIASAVHVIINTMMLQVMGPGLALNGPVGSMARAAEGMRLELMPVIYAFALMMVFFTITTTLMFWVVMDLYASLVDTVVFGFAALCWYKAVKRVYYRLHWNTVDDWNVERETEFDKDSATETSANPILQQSSAPDTVNADNHQNHKANGRGNVLSGIFGKKPQDQIEGNVHKYVDPSSIRCEGYLLMRGVTNSTGNSIFSGSTGNWERKYFVLLANGHLFYYINRQEFRDNPTNRDRPLQLEDYFIEVFNNSKNVIEDDKFSVHSSSRSVTDSGKSSREVKIFFQINLLPRDQLSCRWLLRCNTEEELEMWVDAMRALSPTSFDLSKN